MLRVTVPVRQALTHVAGTGISRKAVFFLSRDRASYGFLWAAEATPRKDLQEVARCLVLLLPHLGACPLMGRVVPRG